MQKTKEMQTKIKNLHVKIELYRVELKKINELKITIKKKEEDIRRIEKVFTNTRKENLKYETFIKDKNPVILNKELKQKLEEIKNDREVQENKYLIETKTSLLEEIKKLREKLELNAPEDTNDTQAVEELEIIITGIKNRYAYKDHLFRKPNYS